MSKTKSAVMLEDLHVNGMLARSTASHNRHLAQAISDVGMHEFRRQLKYKSAWYGCDVFLADRFFPSSKQCSDCGTIKDNLNLSERTYYCEHCGLVMDRDLNAAINLMQLLHTT